MPFASMKWLVPVAALMSVTGVVWFSGKGEILRSIRGVGDRQRSREDVGVDISSGRDDDDVATGQIHLLRKQCRQCGGAARLDHELEVTKRCRHCAERLRI